MTSRIKQRVFMQRQSGKNRVGSPGKPIRFSPYSKDRYLPWHKVEYPNSHYRVEQIFRSHLIPFFGARSLTQVNAGAVAKYTEARNNGSASATIAKELRQLNASLNKAVEWQLLDRNRAEIVSTAEEKGPDAEIHFYTAEQLEALYAYARQAHQTPGVRSVCWAPFWRFLANTGLQRSEAIGLRWADIKREHIEVRATGGRKTKIDVPRDIPLSDGAREALAEIKGFTGKEDFVFPRITLPKLSARFALHAEKVGIGGSLLWLRNSFIAHLVMRGLPLTTVQQWAGYATFALVERYAYLGPDSPIPDLDNLLL